MRLAHAADTHLGYRAYTRMASSGHNQRETDVALAFRAMVNGMIEARPDVVLFAGDFFDAPKPSNTAIRFAVAQLQRIKTELPGVPVVIISGNHDENRRMETGSILPMFADLGLADVAQGDARQFVYPELDLRIVAVPHTAVTSGEIPASEGDERWQILLAHAEVQGVYRKGADRASGQIPADVLNGPWSAVCLGDFHICHQVADRVHYPGSTEFTSSNPWAEIGTPKSWLLWDLDSGDVTPQPIPLARRVYDLEPIDAVGLSSTEVDALIAQRIGGQDIADALVRLIVRDIPPAVSRELAHAQIRAWKTSALHFNLDFRRPDVVHSAAAREFIAAVRRQPFAEMVTDYMEKRELTPGLDRTAFLDLSRRTIESVDPLTTGETAKESTAA